MIPATFERVLAQVAEDDRVLDVGGWAAPFNRADWVIDLKPYETRGAMLADGIGPGPERFSRDTWVAADICDHEPWPFEDDFFDFAVCSFTLEDVRDPIRACAELSRVARAGVVEVPSLLDELTWQVPEASGGPWVGHRHHRWLCSYEKGELVFLVKHHSLHSRPSQRVPPQLAAGLADAERALTVFWRGTIAAREREAIDAYPDEELERVVRKRFPGAASGGAAHRGPARARGIARRLGERLAAAAGRTSRPR